MEEAGCTPAPGVPLLVVVCASGCSAAAKSLQSCPTLCDPIDGSPSGSRVPGILRARVLEWGATAFSAPVALVEASSSDILCRRRLGVDLPLADPPGLEPLPTSSVTRRASRDPNQPSPRPVLGMGRGAWGHTWWFYPLSCRSAGEESLTVSRWRGEGGAQIRSGGSRRGRESRRVL